MKDTPAYPPIAHFKFTDVSRPPSLSDHTEVIHICSQKDTDLESVIVIDEKSIARRAKDDDIPTLRPDTLDRMHLHPSIAVSTFFGEQLLHTLDQRIHSNTDVGNQTRSAPANATIDERSTSSQRKTLAVVDPPRAGTQGNLHSDVL